MDYPTAKYVQDGKSLNFRNTTAATIACGDVVLLTQRYGIAAGNIPPASVGVVAVDGVYELPAENTVAFEVGQSVYWNPSDKKVTATAGELKGIGWVTAEKAAGASKCCVKLGG